MNLWGWVLEFVFPTRCVSCGKGGKLLCQACQGKLAPADKFYCVVCQKPAISGITHLGCMSGHVPERVLSGFSYKGPARDLVRTLKYGRVRNVAKTMANLLVEDLEEKGISFGSKALVVPIPLSFWRKNSRGFNQASLLAQKTAQNLNLRFDPDVLRKRKDTPSQVSLSKRERARNVVDAFSATSNLKGQDILLVDDVLTTGATVREAAKALKKAGAGQVWVLTFARD